jgi:hypothetical protein
VIDGRRTPVVAAALQLGPGDLPHGDETPPDEVMTATAYGGRPDLYTLSDVSLDDAIHAARQQAHLWDQVKQQAKDQEQQQRAEVLALGKEAAAKLAELGNEVFVRVEKTKWFQLGGYRDAEGSRYRAVSGQRCWVLQKIHGCRGRDSSGPFLDSPVLLLCDGTIGRFWPIPQGLRPSGLDEDDTIEYLSTIVLDPIEDDPSLFVGAGDRTYVGAVKRHLAEAIVAYERKARR